MSIVIAALAALFLVAPPSSTSSITRTNVTAPTGPGPIVYDVLPPYGL
ncbi:MAG: hypothetical protein JWM87_4581 [Candidatus Eremiobacteraeota bacterium]|nr:hypothetical protein [Candidatus Eremiobacteraeota bacterium]